MLRTIKINGQALPLKPSANFLFYYRRARLSGEDAPDFQSDLKKLADMEKLRGEFSKIDDGNALDVLQKTNIFEFTAIIRRMLWTFAYAANKSIPPFEEWCDALEEYDAAEASNTVMELVNDNFFSYAGRAEAGGGSKRVDWRDALYLGKSAGLSFHELDELAFSDLLSYLDFLTDEKGKVKDATQADIDQLAM